MSLRILFLTWEGDLAGSTYSIATLTKGLSERGHQVYLGIRKESLLWELVEGSDVERIPMTFKGKFDISNWKQIRDAVNTYNIQVINAQSGIDRYTSVISRFAFRFKSKIIHTRRQMPLSSGNPLQLHVFNSRTEGIIAVSEQVSLALQKLGVRSEKITVISNGTNPDKYKAIEATKTEAIKERLQIQATDYVIGCVSRLKNQVQILQALQKIKEPVTMIFCGIEPTEEMNAIITTYETPHRVIFEGDVSNEEVLHYYPLFDQKILASTQEGLSQSLLEAMALEVPVIATGFAGNLDLIKDEENGLLFQDNDIDQLARNINSIRHNDLLKQELIKNGKETALVNFNIDKTVTKYEQFFNRIILD